MKAIKRTIVTIELSEEETKILANAQYIWEKIANELDYINCLTNENEEFFDDMNEKFSYLFSCLENGFEVKEGED